MDFSQRFVALDIESTGLMYEYFDEPTEIALIEIIDGKLTGKEMHFYLKPAPKKIPSLKFLQKVFGKNLMKDLGVKDFDSCKEKIDKLKELDPQNIEYLPLMEEYENVVNMSNDMLNNIKCGKSKQEVLPIVRGFIENSIVVGHNVKFDVNFLNYWFNYLNLPLINNYICTMDSYKANVDSKSYNLGACCEHYDISLIGAHNALADTKACAELFIKEFNEFPDDICSYFYDTYEAYANFKKRVLNASYTTFAKAAISDTCSIPKNIEDLGDNEIAYCNNLFFKFKKPIEVAKITSLDVSSVDALFINWINCININKHKELIQDRYLKDLCIELLKYCDKDEEKIRKCVNLLVDKDPNYFYIALFNKLEYKKDEMEYDLNDFSYYFENLRNLNGLANTINKDISYIYKFLLLWIGEDNSRFLKYKQFFRDNYKKIPTNENQKSLYNVVENASNKDYILKQLGIL